METKKGKWKQREENGNVERKMKQREENENGNKERRE